MTGQIECKYIVNNTFVTFHKYIFIGKLFGKNLPINHLFPQ